MISKKEFYGIIAVILVAVGLGYTFVFFHTKDVIESYRKSSPVVNAVQSNSMKAQWFLEASRRIYVYTGILVDNGKWSRDEIDTLKSMVLVYNTEVTKYGQLPAA